MFDEEAIRRQFPILATRVPSGRGRANPLRYFDHAASTHAPRPVTQRVVEVAETSYANVHRANHHLSRVATDAFEEARAQLLRFIHAPKDGSLVFAQNTTGALALASHLMADVPGDVVVSHLEHHSNDLPHRRTSRVHRVDPKGDLGSLPERIGHVLRRRRVKLVAVTGASNVTGECPDVHAIARLAHEHGARILVDAAQLLAHRSIDVKREGHPAHLDFVAAAGHKTYAPFGSSFLYAPRETLDAAPPVLPGGGTVSVVTPDEVLHLDGPERHEAGTPNVLGAVAFARATEWLTGVGMDEVEAHERLLLERMRRGLAKVPGLTTYQVGGAPDRLGVVPFLLNGWTHADLARTLDDNWGIATRDGCFCAQPFVSDLLEVPEEDRKRIARTRGKGEMPGLVRASLGIYNTAREVDVLVDALTDLSSRRTPAQRAIAVER